MHRVQLALRRNPFKSRINFLRAGAADVSPDFRILDAFLVMHCQTRAFLLERDVHPFETIIPLRS